MASARMFTSRLPNNFLFNVYLEAAQDDPGDPVDIEPVDADLQAEVNALVAQAEALGIDTESIQEDGRETDGEPK